MGDCEEKDGFIERVLYREDEPADSISRSEWDACAVLHNGKTNELRAKSGGAVDLSALIGQNITIRYG